MSGTELNWHVRIILMHVVTPNDSTLHSKTTHDIVCKMLILSFAQACHVAEPSAETMYNYTV